MNRRKSGKVSAELARAQARFESWRRRRKPKTRIPNRLWKLAAKLVPAHGLHRTSSTLRLDYYSLKEHVEATASSQESPGHTFLEVASPITVVKECAMEFEDDAGATARLQLKGYDATDVVAVARSFWNVS